MNGKGLVKRDELQLQELILELHYLYKKAKTYSERKKREFQLHNLIQGIKSSTSFYIPSIAFSRIRMITVRKKKSMDNNPAF